MQFRDLVAWQRAMDLAEGIYRVTHLLPPDERFGLVTQMRRSARSIPANIAEGYGRARTGDYRRFLAIAFGSLLELETDLELASRLGLIPNPQLRSVMALASEVGHLLAALRRSLRHCKPRSGGPDS
jgi:four helix bundle protein